MTQASATVRSEQSADTAKGGTLATTESALATSDGKISVAQGVVQKIAGMACREISGVHSMGSGGSRALGAIKQRIPGSSGPNIAQGVGVEVGETQAAIDLDIVVEYGVSVADVGRSIQRNVKQSVERMAGLEVVEVNVNVDDVHLPDTGDDAPVASRMSQGHPAPSDVASVVVDGVNIDALADALRACRGVAGVGSNAAGAIATYLPGRRVAGIRVERDVLSLEISASWGSSSVDLYQAVREAAGPYAGGRRVDLTIIDVADPGEGT